MVRQLGLPLLSPIPASTDYFDKCTFGAHGDAYLVTGSGNTVVRLSQPGGPEVRIAGSLDSLLLAEPTACAFGRSFLDQGVLYVVMAGGLAALVQGRYVPGGSVVAIEAETRS